ncbi:outer membrane beta-barrel protein [Pleionea sediminis]|uniref:outer membrane beta-barrel protein n=1 Tax=Pleionea sediminis TaxID=2569479 RepID=UPI001185FA1A|nr:outer membrane beta-barrel protein [Pleionea sediminis]
MKRLLAPLCLLIAGSLQAESGFFVSLNGGYTEVQDSAANTDSATGFEFGYKMNENFTVKFGVKDFGEYDDSARINDSTRISTESTLTSRNVSFVYSLPLDDSFTFNAEVGYLDWKFDSETTLSEYDDWRNRWEHTSTTSNASDSDFAWGLGLAYNMSIIELGFNFNSYKFDKTDVKETELTVTYYF